MARMPKPERPLRINVSLLLYPSRHQAILDYLQQSDGLSRAAKIITAITAALTGGVLTPVETGGGGGEAAMFADMTELVF